MEKKMATTIVYWGYVGIMEKKMETAVYGPALPARPHHTYPLGIAIQTLPIKQKIL